MEFWLESKILKTCILKILKWWRTSQPVSFELKIFLLEINTGRTLKHFAHQEGVFINVHVLLSSFGWNVNVTMVEVMYRGRKIV